MAMPIAPVHREERVYYTGKSFEKPQRQYLLIDDKEPAPFHNKMNVMLCIRILHVLTCRGFFWRFVLIFYFPLSVRSTSTRVYQSSLSPPRVQRVSAATTATVSKNDKLCKSYSWTAFEKSRINDCNKSFLFLCFFFFFFCIFFYSENIYCVESINICHDSGNIHSDSENTPSYPVGQL